MVRLFLGLCLFVCSLSVAAHVGDLSRADSLFTQQKYTEAFLLYDSIYEQGYASPSMILKMAFIQDGLGNYPKALYFLNEYYEMTADREVLGKIQEIATNKELEGYQLNDLDYFQVLLTKYKTPLMFLLLSAALLLVVYIFKKSGKGERPLAAAVLQVVVLALLFAVNNMKYDVAGIVMADNTLLRSGPSAGAEPLTLIGKGHRLKVIERDEAWTKVIWEGEQAYIRNGRIAII
jgi:hypothetical protein